MSSQEVSAQNIDVQNVKQYSVIPFINPIFIGGSINSKYLFSSQSEKLIYRFKILVHSSVDGVNWDEP